MISRPALRKALEEALRRSPVVALLGPRQCGKTTLARVFARGRPAEFLDLEDPTDRARLAHPKIALEPLRGLVVIDEVQRMPGLMEVLRVLADRRPVRARFLLLGSASPDLVKGASESLAGRIAFVEMGGLDVSEAGAARAGALWLRGGLPPSFLARAESDSLAWREDFVRTFLDRDLPQLGVSVPSDTLRRFWSMIAHFHGQIWNASEFARSLGSSEPTARRYLDILSGAYVVRALQPWHENLSKRQVKAPKVYVRDSGLLHSLLSVRTRRDLEGHPKFGASWEGFGVEQVLRLLRPREAYFWATHAGAELDLLVFLGNRRVGFEFKATDAPTLTRSMHVALEDLRLQRLYVVYPGRRAFPLSGRVEALPVEELPRLAP